MLLGFISAVTFATILAVVSGLALAGAAAASHDLYARVIRRGQASEAEEVRASKIATVALNLVAMALGVLFENQNSAFMVGLVFAVAASANFPVILLSVAWSRLTTRGAAAGGLAGLLCALGMVLLSPGVWTPTLKLGPAPFPYDNPALFSMPLAFATVWLVSTLDRTTAAARVHAAFDASTCGRRPGSPSSNGQFSNQPEGDHPMDTATASTQQPSAPPGADWPAAIRAEFAASEYDPRVGTRLLSANDRVRVWEIRLKPDERIGFHRHVLDYVWTAVTPGKALSHQGDGSTVEATYAAGQTQHYVYSAGEYKVPDLENIGPTELSFTTVEFLRSANPPMPLPP